MSVAAHMNYWAQQRNMLKLMYQAHYPEATIDQVRTELGDNLESSSLIYPPTLRSLGFGPNQTIEQKKRLLGIERKTPLITENERKFMDHMKNKSVEVRKANWKWRISQELEDKKHWYPFFITLTVDPKRNDPKSLWTETNEFRKYIKSLCNVVTKKLGHPPAHKKPYRPQSNYVTYIGVLEHGKSREHHHMHLLVWMRDIPEAWKICPNSSIVNPRHRTNRTCDELSVMWKHASYNPEDGKYLAPAIYFRYKGDIWSSKHNHALPLDKDGKPLYVGGIRQAAAYLCKYMQKDKKEWQHRVKATRNLGMNKLKEVIKSLPRAVTEALTWRPLNSKLLHLVSSIHSVPQGLMRLEAKRSHFANCLESKTLDIKTLIKTSGSPFIEMLKSVRLGARPDRMHSQEFYDWVSQFLPVENGYCEKRLIEANQYLQPHFKRLTIHVNPQTLPGNNSGFTHIIQNRSETTSSR
jgi:hypothetical protein